ncbi:leucine-rich repeat domain-containing protein [uncultured Prevotella sp.]|uniref:leucine-rich repeat domain-containing protein n=1 Tax=uncultured Prevotella sp. TaxID=159272 RepID=UPI0027E235D7|nr:leucine-rich repeat domain-containing protein [uncultured Prevotella sp.]
MDISKRNFGAKVVAHEVVDGKCVIEFDAPITKIPMNAFRKKKLTGNLVIPNSITTIEKSAFYGCTGLSGNLTIPNSVTTIGESAFLKCSGFTGNLTIPNSVKTIEKLAFRGCTGFKGDLTIPNSVTTIGESVFFGCTGLSGNLTIPNSVTTIGETAFSNCIGFTGNLTIPNSVTTIGNFAFSYCTGFTGDLSLPKSLEVVGSRSFEFCNKIQSIKFQSLPEGISGYLGVRTKTVSLSDDSYISDMARGTVNEISYTRVMTSNWGTLVLPYPLKLTGEEPYRLYSIDNMTGEELVLKQLEGVVDAGTACVVKRNGSEAELTFGANKAALKMAIDDQPMDGMNFRGTYWTKDVADGYIIAKDCFWNVEKLKGVGSVTAVKVRPFRAWLDGTSANAPAQLSMRIDGSTTGIDAIDALNDAEAEYYDLSGKRLVEPQRGVNIVRMKSGKTKKIIIK